MNATEQLYGLVGDDELFDIIGDIAIDPDANIWDDERVQNRLEELGVYMVTPAEPAVAAETPPVAEGRPEDLPGIDYPRPGEGPRKAPASDEHNPYPFSREEDEDYFRDIFRKKREAAKQQGMSEGYQLDEGAVETITALVKKIPGIGKYYQLAQQYKPQLIEILKTSKSGKEVKQKMEQLVAQQPAPVAESGLLKQLGGLAVGGGSILSTIWMNAMGMIDGVLAHATAGEIGGAVASGSILGLIPVTLMLFAAMLLFKGSKQSSDEKAQAVQAQRGQQGVAEADNLATFEQAQCNQTMEGEYCPEHGLAECGNYGMYESELARIKSLALFK
jgi:hypothetical protein